MSHWRPQNRRREEFLEAQRAVARDRLPDLIKQTVQHLHERIDQAMADLTALSAAVTELEATAASAVTALQGSPSQASIDALTTSVSSANTSLAAAVAAVAPAPAPAPVADPSAPVVDPSAPPAS